MTQPAAERVQLLCLDVDGVLTDGSILIDDHGVETKSFHVRDGAGLRCWMKLGYEVAIITGRSGGALRHRAKELGIHRVVQGSRNKLDAFRDVLHSCQLTASQAAMIGDDLPDLGIMKLCGYPIAVADAAPEVREVAEYVTMRVGGRGAVRESIEHLLRAREEWDDVLALYA